MKLKHVESWFWLLFTLLFLILVIYGIKNGDLSLIQMESSTL